MAKKDVIIESSDSTIGLIEKLVSPFDNDKMFQRPDIKKMGKRIRKMINQGVSPDVVKEMLKSEVEFYADFMKNNGENKKRTQKQHIHDKASVRRSEYERANISLENIEKEIKVLEEDRKHIEILLSRRSIFGARNKEVDINEQDED